MYGHYSLNGNGSSLQTKTLAYDDYLKKFITNSFCFRKNYFKPVTLLHQKIYKSTFFFDVNSPLFQTILKKLILSGIDTTILCYIKEKGS
jgi:hypothetical protein